jgi:conjugative transposon TraM protein
MTTTMNKKTDWKKYLVFAAMGLLFAGAMYMIVAPSAKTKEEQKFGMGLNTEIPAPASSEIVEDKRAAYENEKVIQMQQERMKTLADFTKITDVEYDPTVNVEDVSLVNENPKPEAKKAGGNDRQSSVQTSVDAYRDMNRSLGSFYEQPKEDAQVKQLKGEVEELKSQLESQPKGMTKEEQMRAVRRLPKTQSALAFTMTRRSATVWKRSAMSASG